MAAAQGLTGALIGVIRDVDGGVLVGAAVRVSSPALIGGPTTLTTNEHGQLRFPALPPGRYMLDIELPGFTGYHEEDIDIGAGATIERTLVLQLVGLLETVVVRGSGSRIDARNPGFGTRFGAEDLNTIPTRRTGMSDFLRAAPGVSATSPSSGTNPTVSAFGSGINENQFLIDGTNFTAPGTGIARAEPGGHFIQEIHVQSLGASAEFGNVQGAVINVITKQGSERFLFDAAYYTQPASLTSQPVRLGIPGGETSGYERARYRDFTSTLGGPVVGDRLWFFTGYQHVRDYDSQPGSEPAFPRTYKQDKILAKLTWRLAPGWQLMQSFHDEIGVNPDRPTVVTPFAATLRLRHTVPAITFGHLTHTSGGNTVWDVRVGRFGYNQVDGLPTTSNEIVPSRVDRVTGVTRDAPGSIGEVNNVRTTAKATMSNYRHGVWGSDHAWKIGGQVESGEHRAVRIIPTGVRYEDRSGTPFQRVTSEPSNNGGRFVTVGAFASDALTVRNWLTINAGLRFDHSRAIVQDVNERDAERRDTGEIVRGLGTIYTWNVFSPRLGLTAKLDDEGRTLIRASYGRFRQGVMTGEVSPIHPGVTSMTTTAFNPAAGTYTGIVRIVDPKINLQIDPETRSPRTDELSIGVDREIGPLGLAIAYVRKDGDSFIGWTDLGGRYRQETRMLADGRSVPVFALVNTAGDRRFQLTNPDGYSLTYNGLVMTVEKRRSNGWQAFGSYTLSKASGLQGSSGTTAAGAQTNTGSVFGRDPNDFTNARGRLPNDRPHMVRVMGSAELPRTGLMFASNLQISSGKPWAATAQVSLPQGDQRILLEPRGARRLSTQTLLDLRLSRAIAVGRLGRVELVVDVLNALNDTAEEGLTTDNLFSPNFGQPTNFVDPRRAMVSVRMNLGR